MREEKKIINILSSSKSPVAGVALAKELDVSRQVIVQDIALLRANGASDFFDKQRISDTGG